MSSTTLKGFLNQIFGLNSAAPLLCALVAVIALIIYTTTSSAQSGMGKRPPGPPRRLFGLRKSAAGMSPWKAFTLLQRKFGPVVSVYQGRTLVVVLGTIKAATDLLDKRGSIYSSRPRNIMASELMSGGMRGLAMPYGTRWRNWRSLMHAGMGVEASNGYKTLQSVESKILVHDLMVEEHPARHASHLRRFAVSIVYCVAYGRRVQSLDDPLVVANLKTDESFVSFSTQGKFIVESWPILLKLPHFLQWFRAAPLAQRAADTELYMSLMNSVRKQMALGVAPPSTATRGLERQDEFGLNDVETAYALSSPFSAGVGTTLATLEVFFLAMLHHPQAMQRAQAELDSVVGPHRLPEFEDAESLPYIKALIKETMRWRPIAPLAVPHSVIADDTYDDMFIPKGSTVIANIYSMSKDEEMFPSPDEFDPERYLETDKAKLASANPPHPMFFFGFGRRVCPGMHVAQNSLFIVITRVLWAFNIVPPRDDNGTPILPSKASDDFIGGLVIRPRPFTYVLEPRKEKGDLRAFVEEEWKKAVEEARVWT